MQLLIKEALVSNNSVGVAHQYTVVSRIKDSCGIE